MFNVISFFLSVPATLSSHGRRSKPLCLFLASFLLALTFYVHLIHTCHIGLLLQPVAFDAAIFPDGQQPERSPFTQVPKTCPACALLDILSGAQISLATFFSFLTQICFVVLALFLRASIRSTFHFLSRAPPF